MVRRQVKDADLAGRTGSFANDWLAAAALNWALEFASRTFRQCATDSLVGLPGGTRGYSVLASVAHDRARSQLALAQYLGVDKTAMTYLLDELEGAGLVQRRPDPEDRRQRQVVLTVLGHRSLDEFGVLLAAAQDRLLSALSPDEALAFREMVVRIAKAVREDANALTPFERVLD